MFFSSFRFTVFKQDGMRWRYNSDQGRVGQVEKETRTKRCRRSETSQVGSLRFVTTGLCYLSSSFYPVVQVLAKKGVVACEMGRIYNKEAVIEMLLNKDRSTCPPWASHIEKLKDVVELDLTINPAYEAKRKDAVGDGMYQDKLVSRFSTASKDPIILNNYLPYTAPLSGINVL